jgi:hypothetical protein
VAFSFLPALPRAEAAAALRNRAAQLRGEVEQLRVALDSAWSREKPAFVDWMWELSIEKAEIEIAWCERVARRVADGVSYLPANVRAGDGWERWSARLPGEHGPGEHRPDEHGSDEHRPDDTQH